MTIISACFKKLWSTNTTVEEVKGIMDTQVTCSYYGGVSESFGLCFCWCHSRVVLAMADAPFCYLALCISGL